MEKIVKIGNKEYKMKSSAFTIYAYKNETNRDFMKDMQDIYSKFKDLDLESKKKEEMFSVLGSAGDLIETIEKLAYVMVKEGDKDQVLNFEDFLRGIDSLFSNSDWISDVVDLATSTF